MDLDQTDAAAVICRRDQPMICGTLRHEEDDESDTPAFLRRRKKNKQSDETKECR